MPGDDLPRDQPPVVVPNNSGGLSVFLIGKNGRLYRNDQVAGNRSIRFRLVGTKSNREAIGATVRIFYNG